MMSALLSPREGMKIKESAADAAPEDRLKQAKACPTKDVLVG
jgi:hypothetical protein